jgi:hypothetical protein
VDAPARAYYAVSRADGTYRMTGLPAGRYTAFAYRPGYLGGSIMVPAIVRELKEGERAVADLRLEPEGVISGRVVDAYGNGSQDLMAEATGAFRGDAFQGIFGGHEGMSYTDEAGAFRIRGLAHDRYRIHASIDRRGAPADSDESSGVSYSTTYYPSTPNEGDAEWIDLPMGGAVAGVEIRLVRTPSLHIKGRLTSDGATLSPARLELLTLDGALFTETWPATDGTFIFSHLPPGQYQIVGYGGSAPRELRSPAVKVEIKDSSVEGIELSISAEPTRGKQIERY